MSNAPHIFFCSSSLPNCLHKPTIIGLCEGHYTSYPIIVLIYLDVFENNPNYMWDYMWDYMWSKMKKRLEEYKSYGYR